MVLSISFPSYNMTMTIMEEMVIFTHNFSLSILLPPSHGYHKLSDEHFKYYIDMKIVVCSVTRIHKKIAKNNDKDNSEENCIFLTSFPLFFQVLWNHLILEEIVEYTFVLNYLISSSNWLRKYLRGNFHDA